MKKNKKESYDELRKRAEKVRAAAEKKQQAEREAFLRGEGIAFERYNKSIAKQREIERIRDRRNLEKANKAKAKFKPKHTFSISGEARRKAHRKWAKAQAKAILQALDKHRG